MIKIQLKAWFMYGMICHRVNGKYYFFYESARKEKDRLLSTNHDVIDWTSLSIYPRFVGVFTGFNCVGKS